MTRLAVSLTPCSRSRFRPAHGRLARSPRSCNLSANQEDPAVAGGGASGGRHRKDKITECVLLEAAHGSGGPHSTLGRHGWGGSTQMQVPRNTGTPRI
jgi:hypothetical protein